MKAPERPAKRVHCTRCLRPQNTCICQWITPTPHTVEVVILQHPLEAPNAKGSARLLHLSLPHSRMLEGEVFDPRLLPAVLTAPWQVDVAPQGPRQAILLYPQTPEAIAPGGLATSATSVALPVLPRDPAQLRLIVLDGTWRKTRKMLALNPMLQQIPRLPLCDRPPSRYLIRRAHRPEQLSTLEAVCAALIQLEADTARFQPLLAAFDGFVAQQRAYAPGPNGARTALAQPGTHEGVDDLALQHQVDQQDRQ